MELKDQRRLRALNSTDLLDSLPEEQFDRLTRIASRLLGAPVALISLVDDHRQFFKSQLGLEGPVADARETPLSHSFCQTVVNTEAPLVVTDAPLDERVKSNLAIQDLGVLAYCGVPLRTEDGAVLGSLCVIDDKPRQWSDEDVSTLRDLAEVVMSEVELRRALKEERLLRTEVDEIATTLQTALLPPVLPELPGVELGAAYFPFQSGTQVGGDFYDVYQGSDDSWHIVVGDVCGKGVVAARTSILVRDMLRAAALRNATPVQALRLADEALTQMEHPFVAVTLINLKKTATGMRATITLAGQPQAIFFQDGKFRLVGEYGPILGADVGNIQEHQSAELELGPGDRLALFTDGVTDSLGSMVSEADIAAGLADAPPISTEELVDRIVKTAYDLDGSTRTPTDDIAVVAVGVPVD